MLFSQSTILHIIIREAIILLAQILIQKIMLNKRKKGVMPQNEKIEQLKVSVLKSLPRVIIKLIEILFKLENN